MNTLSELEDLEWRLDSMKESGIETTITIEKAIDLCKAVSANEVSTVLELEVIKNNKSTSYLTDKFTGEYNDLKCELEGLRSEYVKSRKEVTGLKNELIGLEAGETARPKEIKRLNNLEEFYNLVREHVIVHGLELNVTAFNNFHNNAGLD